MYCFQVNPVEIDKGKCEKKRAERLAPNYFTVGYPHSFQHTENTGIFQGKLTEVKAITKDTTFFPLKFLLLKPLNIFSALFLIEFFFRLWIPIFCFLLSKTQRKEKVSKMLRNRVSVKSQGN